MVRFCTIVLAIFSLCLCGVGTALATSWTVVDLGTGDGLNGGNHANTGNYAAVINNLGNVAYMRDTTSPYPSSFFYNKSTHTIVSMGDLGGGETEVFGLNDSNVVVGQSYATLSSAYADAMAWKWNGSTGGTMINLHSAIGVASGIVNYGWGMTPPDK